MSSMTETPKQPFRLSMLIYDSRYRSLTIQIFALLAFLAGVVWIYSNTMQNLASLGKAPDFGFLMEPSGYDINQRLIEYHSQSTHARAAFVGLLNTLLVAVAGCALATILGVFIGVLRLSRNWLVGRLMTVYVEAFRNVPVLLWIVFLMAIVSEVPPKPAAFRSGEAQMLLGDSIAVTNRGIYIPEPVFANSLGDITVLKGVLNDSFYFSISLDLIAILAAFLGGLVVSGLIKRRADRIQEATGERPTTWYLRLGIAIIPTVIVLGLLGFHLAYPELKGFNFRGGIHLRNSFVALWIALSLYTAAFIAEVVRSGIMAISKGQTEAAAALGLRSGKIMSLVILPQALRIIIPPLISQYLNLTKNTSLAIAVGYMDITGTLGGITLNQTGRELECLLLLMLIYLTISLSISSVMNWYNERVKLTER